MSGAPESTLFFGRLHPLLVHLPIGLIVLLAFLELLSLFPRFRNATSGARFILALAVPLSVLTVACGWFLSWGGGYGVQLLAWHKWTGIATAVACGLAGLFYWLNLKQAYRLSLFLCCSALVVASHYGGSLTHGSDYLVQYAPKSLRTLFHLDGNSTLSQAKLKEIPQMIPFADLIQPVLRQDCVSCHGPDKAEAELKVDSIAGLLKGGKAGPALVAGKSGESSIVSRMRLPLNDKGHMPPEGKPQPAQDQITLIEWWIDAGALVEKSFAEFKTPPRILRALHARFGDTSLAKKVSPKPLQEVLPMANQLADELNIALTPLSPNEPWLQCNSSIMGKKFTDVELAKLGPIGPNILWLDLAGTSISDTGLVQLAAMPNLKRLHLERTSVTDGGLAHLKPLMNLEYLNLYRTGISDQGLAQLEELPKLKQLYLWQTKVTSEQAKAFVEAHTDNDAISRMQRQIEEIKSRIKDQQLVVELGTALSNSPTAVVAINTMCPISGKPIVLSKTVMHEGKTVAFCCDDCKAQFLQDPKPFLAKLGLEPKASPSGRDN